MEAFSALVGDTYDDEPEDDYDEPQEPQMDGLTEAIGTDSRRLSEKLGRPLLGGELESAARVILEDVRDGRPVDVERAAAQYWGGKTPDMGGANDRVEWMTRALKERTPEEPVDEDREYDLDNTDDRVAYMHARSQGHEFVDADPRMPRDLSTLDDNELPPAA